MNLIKKASFLQLISIKLIYFAKRMLYYYTNVNCNFKEANKLDINARIVQQQFINHCTCDNAINIYKYIAVLKKSTSTSSHFK